MSDGGTSVADYLIVGAGAAGSVLANRLSADPRRRVVLVEAGPDLPPGREPSDIASVFPLAAFNDRYMWPDTRVHWRRRETSPSVPLPQGRILGGSSAVMGMWALRGRPEDYDEWQSLGAAGWRWRDVLPWFRRLETDVDFAGEAHGHDGPLPIRREPEAAWSPLARAVRCTAARQGLAQIEDMNADFGDGHCVLPISRYETRRAGAGLCYLTATVRARPNLRVLTGLTATRLLFGADRVCGIEAARADRSVARLEARETIVATGALRSPVLLMRSGIGPADHLRDCGIQIRCDRSGVGRNLQNHAVLYLLAWLGRAGREARGDRPAGCTYLRWSSGLDGCKPGDLAIYVRSYLTWHEVGRRLASLAPVVASPASRGRITLDPRDPAGPPIIEFNLLDDPRDLRRLMEGFHLAAAFFAAPELAPVCGPAFVMSAPGRVGRYNTLNRLNAWRAALAAAVIDVAPGFGQGIVNRLASAVPAKDLLADPERLAEFATAAVSGTGHVCGTCRMGTAGDPDAVVDPAGRVYGIAGLRVADASIMPTVPSGNTHVPTIMIAEKLADAIAGTPSGA